MHTPPLSTILVGPPPPKIDRLKRLLTVGDLRREIEKVPDDAHIIIGDGEAAWEACRIHINPRLCVIQIC